MEPGRDDWDAIVRRHGPLAFDTAWRILGHAADTEDVVQEALLDAFRLHVVQPVANWGALLRHLATRRAIDRLRKRRQATWVPLDTLEFSASRPFNPNRSRPSVSWSTACAGPSLHFPIARPASSRCAASAKWPTVRSPGRWASAPMPWAWRCTRHEEG